MCPFKGQLHISSIRFLAFQCIQNCYPGVLQDVITKAKYVTEMVSRMTCKIAVKKYISLCKKAGLIYR